MIEIKDCIKGYILKGERNHRPIRIGKRIVLGHYIIFYEHHNGSDFIGAMITSKNFRNVNLPMNEIHFNNSDDLGNPWKVYYKNSYLVPAKLQKMHSMGPFELVGQLTVNGVEFMNESIEQLPLMFWEEYKNS